MKNIRYYLSGLFLMASLMSFSAPALPTYFCNFEDGVENAQWMFFNATNVFPMTWKVGTSAHASGNQSLYSTKINELDSDTRSWAKNGGFTVSAYRKMTLTPGTYQVSIDYYAPQEMVSVALVPADTLTSMQIKTNSGAGYASIIDVANIPGLTNLKKDYWAHATGDVVIPNTSTSTNYLLVVTYRSQGTAREFGAAVDNIEVVKKQFDETACDYPVKRQDFRVDLEAGFAVLTWTGNADQYEVGYYNNENVLEYAVVPASGEDLERFEISLENLPEGLYHFMVRAADTQCGSKSAWTYKYNKLVYDPSDHCIDYLNFDAIGVRCESGNLGSTTDALGVGIPGAVDFGYEAIESRHTIHYLPNERDPRTNNQLPTVPEGAFASVRLGNWEIGAEWESISYTIHVDDNVGVLLLRYALVQENPAHGRNEQPRFDLRITNEAGQLLAGDCGVVDLRPPSDGGAGDGNWHTIGSGYSMIQWRDWTTLGINVRDYIGQTIKIKIVNADCSQSGHFGYGYFVLDCSKGEIEGQTCGDKPRELVVDDGFLYRWYVPSEPNHVFAPDQDPTSRSLDN
ncbi:MAG: DUF4998 domain-containing protein, partial [Paludibacteraceae bacterium]|nr:DUF4998 domain-containing protein [Paludibacteraceae bacterium]